MTLHDWVAQLESTLGVDCEFDDSLILDVARDAAHGVERPAAPLTTFLLGYAWAQQGGSAESLERLAAATTSLAEGFGQNHTDADQ